MVAKADEIINPGLGRMYATHVRGAAFGAVGGRDDARR
jgi:hypothetical protein